MKDIRYQLRNYIEDRVFDSNENLMYHNKNNFGRIIRSDVEHKISRNIRRIYGNLINGITIDINEKI